MSSNTATTPLVALRISNGALASAPTLPEKLKLLNWGENSSVKGPVVVGEKTARVLALNQKARGFAEVAIDFEHNTVPGTEEHERTKEPRPVAAYGTPQLIPNDGLYLVGLKWTPSGKEAAFNYADLSPAVERDENNEVVFLHSTALTRNGAVHELSFYNTAKSANENQNMEKTILVADLATIVGLNADADKAAVLKKIGENFTVLNTVAGLIKDGKLVALTALETTLNSRIKAIEDAGTGKLTALTATGADGKAVTIPVQELVSLAAEFKALKEQIANQGKTLEAVEKGKVISTFAAEGKVPMGEDGKPMSVEALNALTLPELNRLRYNTPVTVPLNGRGRKPLEGQKDNTLTGAERAGEAWAHLEK